MCIFPASHYFFSLRFKYSPQHLALEVCMGPDFALGPGLVAQIMFGCGPGSDLVPMIAIKRYFEHFGISWSIIFSQRKSYS
jgi:hypothetical protein